MLYQRKSRRAPNLEIAPLIDVIFILLIFFAVSTTMITNKQGIKLDLPQAESGVDEKKGVMLSIDSKQQVFIDNRLVNVEFIQKEIKSLLEIDPKLQIIFNAHKIVPYELVINVIDNVRLGGCSDIVLQVEKKKRN